jgi:rhodanese-related sulfurtransferase
MSHQKSLVLLIVLIATLMLAACGGSSAPAASGDAISLADLPTNIDAKMVNQLREREDVILVDVREDWEYAAVHIPGTVLIPLGQLSSRLSEIPMDKTVIAVCRSGNRSDQATALLKQRGFTVHNMLGGMLAWEQAKFAVER